MIGIDAAENDEFAHDGSLMRHFSYGLTSSGHRKTEVGVPAPAAKERGDWGWELID